MESQDFASCYVWCTEYEIEWSIAPAQGALAKQLHLLEGTILNRPSKDDTYLLQSVDNALSIVDLLCESDGLGLADIASRLSLGRSSTYRLLYTLQRHQIIRKDAGARYHLGCRLIAMGQISLSNDELVRAVHPYPTSSALPARRARPRTCAFPRERVASPLWIRSQAVRPSTWAPRWASPWTRT